jgi:membrane protease YdiL (CAAX protease family)
MLSERPWRAETVLQFCAAQFVCFSLGLALGSLLEKTGWAAFKPPDGFGLLLCATLGFQGATWVLIGFLLRRHHLGWREAFGFRKTDLPRALLAAVSVLIVILPVALLLESLSVTVLERLGWPPEAQTAVKLVVSTKFWWTRVYLGLFAVVIAPVAEEFIFRGLLFPFVKQLGYPKLAWIGVSFLFALIHLDAATLIPLFVLALALTWLYEFTDVLLAPIAVHALFNAVNFSLLLWETRPFHP